MSPFPSDGGFGGRTRQETFYPHQPENMLTEDGMRLRQRAEEIISLVEKTEMEFKASDETISGQIAIGAGEIRTFPLIARAMKQTQSRFPHIHFTVYSANAVDVTERLEHGTLDFGLLFEPVNKEHYQYLSMPCAVFTHDSINIAAFQLCTNI